VRFPLLAQVVNLHVNAKYVIFGRKFAVDLGELREPSPNWPVRILLRGTLFSWSRQ